MALDLKILKAIHEDMQDPEKWDDYGICFAYNQRFVEKYGENSQREYEAEEELRAVFEKWPLFSGDFCFPVPHPSRMPGDAYLRASKSETWGRDSGSYAQKRWNLLEFLIECAERQGDDDKS